MFTLRLRNMFMLTIKLMSACKRSEFNDIRVLVSLGAKVLGTRYWVPTLVLF